MLYDPEKRKGAHVFDPRRTSYRVCVQCVMDTSDPEITFDENGVCNHCHDYDKRVDNEVLKGDFAKQELARKIAQIKREGRGKKYDCILGLSGGVDSSYVAYLTKKFGLRPLAVHVDNGWNSEPAVRNIENIVSILGLDLYTRVLDWEEFRRLQLAFLRASTPDSEIPTDHAIVSTLYQMCEKHGVRWIMDGSNVVTEIMSPATWSHGHGDWRYIKHLNDNFGGASLDSYPHYDYYDLTEKYMRRLRLERFPILNYIDYDKFKAIEVLKTELGWQPYGGKHYESIYTRFYQGHILPQKFGFDKRRSHLSCLVRDGRVTRQEALNEMQKPALDEDQVAEDQKFVIKKLGIDEAEFDRIMSAERKTFWDYPSDEMMIGHEPEYSAYWQKRIREEEAERRREVSRAELASDPVGFAKRRVGAAVSRVVGAPVRWVNSATTGGAEFLRRNLPLERYEDLRNRWRQAPRLSSVPGIAVRGVGLAALSVVGFTRGLVMGAAARTRRATRTAAARSINRLARVAYPILNRVTPRVVVDRARSAYRLIMRKI